MTQAIDPDDQLSRLGGDEFMLVSARGGRGRIETDLRLILAAMPNILLPGRCDTLRLSVSVGVALKTRRDLARPNAPRRYGTLRDQGRRPEPDRSRQLAPIE